MIHLNFLNSQSGSDVSIRLA